MRNILIVLCLACVSYAQTRVMGEVAGKTADSISLKTDKGETVNVPVTPDTKVLRVPPGQTSLSNAAVIGIGEVNPGDRVLARANQIIVMSRTDLDQKQAADRAAWQARGSAGKVTEVAADSFTMVTAPGQAVKVATSPGTTFRRYAPESIRFSDARSSTFAELQAGDQVRVLGGRSGEIINAEAIVSGAFRNFAGTVIALNSAAGEITLSDLETKRPVTVKVTPESIARRMPPQMAEAMAQGRGGAPPGEGSAARNAPTGGQPAGGLPAGGLPTGARPAPASTGPSRDLGQMLDRMPALTLAELKPGDALIVASTAGADDSRATAISLLAGVEPLLTGPASDRRLSGSWSLDINMAP